MNDRATPYADLTPDVVLAAVERAGHAVDGRVLALNSYENRVYRVGLTDAAPVVVKFYRPGRWTDAAIREEHAFTLELADADIPVATPLARDGNTLHLCGAFRFAVYPCFGGRAPETAEGSLALIAALRAQGRAAEAEAEAEERTARAQAHRRFATGAAVAISALGIGLGLYLGLLPRVALPEPTTETTVPAPTPEPVPPVSVPKPTSPPATSEGEETTVPPSQPDIITEEYDKFTKKVVQAFGTSWTITAGHHYQSETDAEWQYAWCYTTREVDGVLVSVDLVNRSNASSPAIGPLASEATLAQVSLSPASALALASECAWKDGRTFSVGDFVNPLGPNPFREDEPEVAVVGSVLTYRGVIGPGFSALLQSRVFETLRISSVGGLVDEALSAGRWLRASGKSVEAVEDCLSACVFVLAGGQQRQAGSGARIGVHRFKSDDIVDAAFAMEAAQEKSSEVLQYLETMGIASDLFHAMARIPADSMEILSADDLMKWRLISAPRLAAEAWFNGLDDRSRWVLQSDLMLLGYYRGFVDGKFGPGTAAALTSYAEAVGAEPGSGLSAEELADLRHSARQVFTAFDFVPTADGAGGSSFMIPKSMLARTTDATRGRTFMSPNGKMALETIAKPSRTETLQQLYAMLAKPSATKTVGYAAIAASRFVISGTNSGRNFYLMVQDAGTYNVGFQLSWDAESDAEGAVAATFIASNFFPMMTSFRCRTNARMTPRAASGGLPGCRRRAVPNSPACCRNWRPRCRCRPTASACCCRVRWRRCWRRRRPRVCSLTA